MKLRTHIINFRVSEKDFEFLKQYAKAAGQSVSEYVRTQAFRLHGGARVGALELPSGEHIPVDQLKDARFVLFPFDLPDPEVIKSQGNIFDGVSQETDK